MTEKSNSDLIVGRLLRSNLNRTLTLRINFWTRALRGALALQSVPVELQQLLIGDRFFLCLELRGDQRYFGSEKEANQTGKEDWREGTDIGQFC